MRIKGLDFLRGIAILGVLFRHSELNNLIVRAGWAGVDLFFVLSGFLVSGLLFEEYKRTTNVDGKRFLIRRAFKIYPAFYVFILVSVGFKLFILEENVTNLQLISELFFLQSYIDGLWDHTWSLAVEEHFYFLLIILIWLSLKSNVLAKKTYVISILLTLIAIVFLLRFNYSIDNSEKVFVSFFATHLRIDGLLLGTLIAYLYYFQKNFLEFFLSHKIKFFALSLLLVAPAFLFNGGSFVMNTYGMTLMHIGFAIMVLLFSSREDLLIFKFPATSWLYNLVCFIGLHSYSIYLWHLFVKANFTILLGKTVFSTLAYLVVSVLVGIFTSLIVEKQFLKVRDRIFPIPVIK